MLYFTKQYPGTVTIAIGCVMLSTAAAAASASWLSMSRHRAFDMLEGLLGPNWLESVVAFPATLGSLCICLGIWWRFDRRPKVTDRSDQMPE